MIRAMEIFDVEIGRVQSRRWNSSRSWLAEHERMGRELHDASRFSRCTPPVSWSNRRVGWAEPESVVAGRLDKAIDMLHDAILDLRRNLGELHAAPSDVTLPWGPRSAAWPMTSAIVRWLSWRWILSYRMTRNSPLNACPRPRAQYLVHEALSNTKRHAHARQVLIRAQQEAKGRLVVTIHDDGRGLASGILCQVSGFATCATGHVCWAARWNLPARRARERR